MTKHIANILTASRIVLALILLIFFKEISILFLILYTIGEFTDIIDGTVARKTGSCSYAGAVLDSIADLLLALNIIKIILITKIVTKKILIWIMLALGIGAISSIINYIKHKKIFFIHSISCKICGGIISVIPFAIFFGFIDTYIIFALVCVTFAMIEICIMSILLDEPDPNARSIYSIIKAKNKVTT